MIWERMGLAAMIESLMLATQICDGMAYIGKQLGSFVHRDLKPENVLVKHDQRFDIDTRRVVKITDLGLAKALDEYEDDTAASGTSEGSKTALSTPTGFPLGSHYYMSPEQRIHAKSARVTSDIYSFGIMLFEMLTVAKDAKSPQWHNLMQRLAEELPENRELTPRSINPYIPEALDRMVMKCLERAPENRYPDFSTLRFVLRQVTETIGYGVEPVQIRFTGDRSDLDLLFDRATSLANLDSYEEAGDYLDEVIQLDPNIPEPWVNKGLALFYQGQIEAALECIDKALEIDPKHPHALTCKGMYYERIDDPYEAIRNYDLAIQADPKFADPLINKGGVLSNLGRLDEAIGALDAALKLQPKNEQALQFKGITLEKMERYFEALDCLERALAVDPMNSTTLYEMGQCYFSMGRVDQAEQHYLKSAEITPSPDAYFNIAVCAMKRDDFARAIDYLDKALELRPSYARAKELKQICLRLTSPEAYLNEAVSAMELGDFAKAVEYLDTVLELCPSHARAGEMRQICLHFIRNS
jgi:tetratricopeptide (TPR) repeat protein